MYEGPATSRWAGVESIWNRYFSLEGNVEVVRMDEGPARSRQIRVESIWSLDFSLEGNWCIRTEDLQRGTRDGWLVCLKSSCQPLRTDGRIYPKLERADDEDLRRVGTHVWKDGYLLPSC